MGAAPALGEPTLESAAKAPRLSLFVAPVARAKRRLAGRARGPGRITSLSTLTNDWRRLALAVAAPAALLVGFSLWAGRSVPAGLLPHGFCFSWLPQLLWLHVVSDVMIGLAYLTIPFTIFYFVRKRGDLPFHWVFVLFGLFIVACGSTHFMSVWNIWYPDYWASGAIKAITAAVSVPTGIALVALIPDALSIPTMAQLREAKERLEREVEQRRLIEAQLREAQAVLEGRVAERTRALAEANALLDTMFNSAPVGMGLWDREGRFLRLNDALVDIDGVPRGQHVGQRLADVLPEIAPEAGEYLQRVARTGVAIGRIEVSGRTPASARRRFWQFSFYPVSVGGEQLAVGGVVEEITDKKESELERARLLAEAEAARGEAEAANRRKDEFLAKVSHELRTPLQGMLGWVQMLRSGRLAAADTARAIERVEHNVRSQARLIDDLLDYSRILSGKLRLERQSIDPAVPVQAAIEVVRASAAARGVEIATRVETGGLPMDVDPERLQQVLWNLVSNAVKFSPPGARVEVSAERLDDRLRITVRDYGHGIAPEFLPHVFEPFRQDEQASAGASSAGLGLGLSIARSIVELHGGSIGVDSEGAGKGAKFTVELPAGGGMPAARMPPDAEQAAAPLQGLRVLLVEDDPDAAESMALGLVLEGAQVDHADSYESALSRLREGIHDALVTDLRLGAGRNGHELLAAVRAGRAGEAARELPALAVSAFGSEEDRRASLAAGFLAHLTKPIDATGVARALAASLGRG